MLLFLTKKKLLPLSFILNLGQAERLLKNGCEEQEVTYDTAGKIRI